MSYLLKVKDHFDAAHCLPDHPGKCKNMHGHTWEVEVTYEAETLHPTLSYAVDFAILKARLKDILSKLDHKVLNEVFPYQRNITAEFLSKYIYDALSPFSNVDDGTDVEEGLPVFLVTVWEGSNSSVSYFEKAKE